MDLTLIHSTRVRLFSYSAIRLRVLTSCFALIYVYITGQRVRRRIWFGWGNLVTMYYGHNGGRAKFIRHKYLAMISRKLGGSQGPQPPTPCGGPLSQSSSFRAFGIFITYPSLIFIPRNILCTRT